MGQGVQQLRHPHGHAAASLVDDLETLDANPIHREETDIAHDAERVLQFSVILPGQGVMGKPAQRLGYHLGLFDRDAVSIGIGVFVA